jgi:hypothetical protein
MEARLLQVELTQKEHRAMLVGDSLEGTGGLRGDLAELREETRKQNTFLYVLCGMAAIAVPSHIKDVVAIIAKLLAGA